MADYIDRDAVCYQLEKQATVDGQPRAIRRARRIVAEFPAADVVERKRGEWARMNELDYRCSVCNKRTFINRYPLYAYCPNCGADMREEQDDG